MQQGLERVAQILEGMGGGLVQDGEHELDMLSTETGYRSGQVDTLLWAQEVVQNALASVGRYEDPRPLQRLLAAIQDRLRSVQDGSPVDGD